MAHTDMLEKTGLKRVFLLLSDDGSSQELGIASLVCVSESQRSAYTWFGTKWIAEVGAKRQC